MLYWSLWKERWSSTGTFGRTILSIDDALMLIAAEDIFRVMMGSAGIGKCGKSSLGDAQKKPLQIGDLGEMV